MVKAARIWIELALAAVLAACVPLLLVPWYHSLIRPSVIIVGH